MTGLKIQGRNGRHSLINTNYEAMQTQHNDRPCWVARNVQPSYIFHTGKNRWVISKCLDDGYRCWAFLKGNGYQTPDQISEQWVCCDEDNEWRPDPNVSCSVIPASNDKFVKLRMQCQSEMEKYGLLKNTDLKALWRRLDFNGNNVVSLAEIDKMVVEMVAGGVWPEWLNNKPALMRAYKKTILVDGDGDDWVEKKEFHALLLNLFWFNKLFLIFNEISGIDRRIDVREFVSGCSKLGVNFSPSEAEEEFAKMDGNHGGQVLFVEFCAWIRKRVNPDSNPNFDADIYSGNHCGKLPKNMRKQGGNKATHSHFVKTKCFKEFDDLEAKIQDIMRNRKKLLDLWRRIDFNGNNIVSLAEIDKLVVEAYPLLNHKPALMRAYKKTIRDGNGDDWVQKREFKSLLANLFYFNKIFWVFDQVDENHDRRMNYDEFKMCMVMCGAGLTEAEVRRDFEMVDRNHGGIILFDEFCQYFTRKKCPEAMTELVE